MAESSVIVNPQAGLDVKLITAPPMNVPSIRTVQSRPAVDASLGLLADLAGTWEGEGFNLIARPDRQGGSPLFLELNQTFETLSFVPISSSIPNRGSAVNDVTLFGLTYLQKVSDLVTGGALHIEPGIWVHVPSQDTGSGATLTESVARMGTIPHGNSVLAQGTAIEVTSFTNGTFDIDAISAVNTAPFPVGGVVPAAGTLGGFAPYNLSLTTPAAVNFRTPAGDIPQTPLPAAINGVPMQSVIKDPALLLKAALAGQTLEKMVVIRVASQASLQQLQGNPPAPVNIFSGFAPGGGVENIPFLETNADAATVFATFWLETVKSGLPAPNDTFLQLQYVQTVFLNFPVITPGSTLVGPNLTWPHVSVATLRKTFGGQ